MIKEKMPRFISLLYRQDGYFFVQLVLNISLLVGIFFYVYFLTAVYHNTQEIIPLHYTIYLGIDFLDYWYYIFVLPLLAILIFLIHWMIAVIVYKKHKLIAYILLTASLFFQILTAVYVFFILRLTT